MRIGKIYTILIVIMLTMLFMGCNSEDNEIELSTKKNENDHADMTSQQQIYVHVSGEVESEGVYCVDCGTRLYQVIDKAGGLKKDAEKDCLNLAETVYDGQKIQILSKKEYKEFTKENSNISDSEDGLVDINEATTEQLMKLPGIGQAKANLIVSYRSENGRFSSIEDIKNVSGIGESIFANIESLITVN